MVYETSSAFTPEAAASRKREPWQALVALQEQEDAETIQYWRNASIEDHARVLEEVLVLAYTISQSKHPDYPGGQPPSEPKQFLPAA
jgi:hypothetical protein